MTPPRTQEHRHWVHIQVMPDGPDLGGMDIDLNMVDKVDMKWGVNPNDPDDKDYVVDLIFTYAGVMKPLRVQNDHHHQCESANWFYQKWRKFQRANTGIDCMPMAVPGLLHGVNPGKVIIQR